jgi:hypothetical protein
LKNRVDVCDMNIGGVEESMVELWLFCRATCGLIITPVALRRIDTGPGYGPQIKS